MQGIRLGVVTETALSGSAWLDHVRRVEDSGVDSLLVRDHFTGDAFGPQFAPFSALATAGAITERLRIGTLVLDNDFRHPVIVAHEAASLHDLSGGRFELGMGAGWYEPEYVAAGMSFDPAGRRIDRLEEALTIISGLLAGDRVHFEGEFYRIDGLDLSVLPQRRGRPKLLIGAGGPRMLALAARYADVVGLLPAPITASQDSDDPRDRLPASFDRKLSVLETAAGQRFPHLEVSAFVTIRITDHRRSGTEQLIADRGWGGIQVDQVWEMPTVFIGSEGQIRDDMLHRRERFGLSYLVTSDQDLHTLARLLATS